MKIHHKLFLILFFFSLLLVSGLTLLMQWSIDKGMIQYVHTKEMNQLKPLVAQLANDYQENGSWQFLQNNQLRFHQLMTTYSSSSPFEHQQKLPPHHKSRHHPKKPPPHRGKNHNRSERGQHAVLDENFKVIVGVYLNENEYSQIPVIVNNKTVGYFAIATRNKLAEGYDLDFIEQQQDYFWLIALLSMVLVLLISFPLSRYLLKPIKQLTLGMYQLTQGNYHEKIKLKRNDEIGELIRDYNELALTLSENEQARKRWLANISHELRTPIAIIRGELEAMIDKVRPLSMDNIDSVNDEIKHLQKLIDDLNQLTVADIGGLSYRKEKTNLTKLLNQELTQYHQYLHDAGITLTLDFNPQPIVVHIDKTRFLQLCDNIINNCVKYSQATRCLITLEIDNTHEEAMAKLTFEDDGIGVENHHLPNLFEHLYRVEHSRNRNTGGAGLGLAICQQIVQAHHGNIKAHQASLGGLAIIVTLPLSQ